MLMRTSDQWVESPNQLLRSLSPADRALLSARLERTTVNSGTALLDTGQPITTVYFPETVTVSIERTAGEAKYIETAVVGYEGMVGWSALLGCRRSPQRAMVQMRSGTVLAISAGDLAAVCATSGTLLNSLMRFIEVIMAQMAQAIVSHLRDSLDRRVCRWLLMRHDRVPQDQLFIRHDEISRNLGSRRPSVTDCLHILEGEHLVRCHRGRIIIRDRPGLEQLAGESYGEAEALYRALMSPFGMSDDLFGSDGQAIARLAGSSIVAPGHRSAFVRH
jgi:CRP-like cAMP-binding protein